MLMTLADHDGIMNANLGVVKRSQYSLFSLDSRPVCDFRMRGARKGSDLVNSYKWRAEHRRQRL